MIPEQSPFHDNPIVQVCETLVEEMPNKPVIKFKENRAFYHPFFDYINMPKMNKFNSSEEYYCTLFHELIHSTGHLSRLNRKEVVQMKSLGAEAYSMEELIAETGACFLSSISGISELVFDNSASYINGWLERLKNDKRLIVYASAKAQKAVDFITGVNANELDVPDMTMS
jgi:antirestriction protein ArdC